MKKRVLSVFVAAMLMLTMLTACGSKRDDGLVGEWTCKMDFASYINEGLASEPDLAEHMALDEFILEIKLSLNEDGTYKMHADTEANQAAYEDLKEQLKEGMTSYLTSVAEEADMTLDEVLSAAGTTVDELLDEAFGQEVYEEIVGNMEASGKWDAADGKIYMTDGTEGKIDKSTYETYTLSGDTLTITGSSDGSDTEMYPMEFKK